MHTLDEIYDRLGIIDGQLPCGCVWQKAAAGLTASVTSVVSGAGVLHGAWVTNDTGTNSRVRFYDGSAPGVPSAASFLVVRVPSGATVFVQLDAEFTHGIWVEQQSNPAGGSVTLLYKQ